MPRFTDTKKWKTRTEYEKTSGKPKRAKPKPLSVKCPACGAARATPCFEPYTGELRRQPHQARWERAQQVRRHRVRAAKQTAKAQRERWDGVTVRFECPVCGGDHSRNDHERMTAKPSGDLYRRARAAA